MNKTILIHYFLIITLLSSTFLGAQVGIGTATPNSATLMDISAINGDKGIMITRVSIPDLNNQNPITGTAEESLLVYNTNTTTGKGFHYWTGSKWEKIAGSAASGTQTQDWSRNGNSGTTAGGGANNYIGTSDNVDFSIATNTVERIRVKSNGNVGIGSGATNPSKALDLKTNTADDGLRLDFQDFDFDLVNNGAVLDIKHSTSAGAIAIGFGGNRRLFFDDGIMAPIVDAPNNITTNNGTYDLGRFNRHFRRVYTKGVHTNDDDPNGGLRINIGANGGSVADYHFTNNALFAVENNRNLGRSDRPWNILYYRGASQVSDRRKKENINDLEYGLKKILSLKTYSYTYKDDTESKERYGFMAQDLQTDLPAVVTEAPDEMKSLSVDYTAIIPILVNAIKEQQIQIDELKKRLE
jgi:hypothetical protein